MSTPQLLVGKTAAITGGLTGIGRAIAFGFLSHGASVAINYLGSASDGPILEQLKKEVPEGSRFLAIPGDISKPETGKALVEAVVKEWGRLDVFVSNAGVCQFAEFLSYGQLPPPESPAPIDELFVF